MNDTSAPRASSSPAPADRGGAFQPGRTAACHALAAAARRFPELGPIEVDTRRLDAREARLADAIVGVTLQRWLTLEHLLNRRLRQPLGGTEPMLQAVLLAGAAQLVFMDRIPAHAAVDASVNLARRLVRPKAAGLVNAVLRGLSGLAEASVTGQRWTPRADALPIDVGFVPLSEPCLPEPRDLVQHLPAATSCPGRLVQQWLELYGPDRTTWLAASTCRVPPLVIALEPGLSREGVEALGERYPLAAHEVDGFAVWHGSRDELGAFLAADGSRRVQDPASSAAVGSTASLRPGLILDYCAGSGTKTRQLAGLHPEALIVGCDVDGVRLARLRELAGQVNAASGSGSAGDAGEGVGRDRMTVLEAGRAAGTIAQGEVDLLVLDVPCSNTAVLSRRPEAKYRYREPVIHELVAHQRRIIDAALPLVRPGGHVLYSTCSLEPAENHAQARWILEERPGEIIAETLMLPEGVGVEYRDGGYHALIRLK